MKARDVHRLLRHVIQIIFFLWMPALYTSAYSGIKYVIGQIRDGNPITMNGFLSTFIALCAFTILFGRFFCGYACAFGSLGDGMYALSQGIQKKITKKRKKRISLPWFRSEICVWLQKTKYILLIALIAIYAFGLTDHFAGTSPWEVFSMLYNGNFPGMENLIGYILFFLILIGMCFKERFFCQYLCPMGAAFAWMPVLPVSVLDRDRERCIPKCRACQMKCPVDMEIKRDQKNEGECIHCLQCIDVCPKQNIHLGSGKRFRGHELFFVLIKAVILILICLFTVNM
ncbi:MAG: 4Fe-4S binding protein [Lachnospiraceae bacterium]|nr:4Fe-4S binding protein [Lachnospiraceae bacterium]